jgi:CspA family cold shock protein
VYSRLWQNPIIQSEFDTGVTTMARVKGTVKWFNADKGYGFISPEEGDDLFVHYSEIQDSGFRTLEEGTTVEFEITQGKKGKQASAVKVVK